MTTNVKLQEPLSNRQKRKQFVVDFSVNFNRVHNLIPAPVSRLILILLNSMLIPCVVDLLRNVSV